MSYTPPLDRMQFVIEQVLDAPASWRAQPDFADLGARTRREGVAPAGRFAASAGMPVDLAGNVREWTQSCEWKEIGAVRRLFSNLGRMLQGKERDASGRVCVGRYVAGSGWRDPALDRAPSSEDEDQGSIDRGFRLVREIR